VSVLRVSDLRARVGRRLILDGVNLEVASGEVHALMGPNASGKSTLSHVLMGNGDYEVMSGSVTLDGVELLGRPTHERAAAGLFLAMQYPVEVPGVSLEALMREALLARGESPDGLTDRLATEADTVGLEQSVLRRAVNVAFSGGEKKRNETVQLAVLRPKIAVIDEIDSGLDIDALRQVSRRIEAMTTEDGLGVLAITHYARLLTELRPDRVHVLGEGRIVMSGGPELADELESSGYAGLGIEEKEPAGEL
jgi:Fe-S cluster assembly ATP-binding protein